MKLAELLSGVEIDDVRGSVDVEVSSIECDSRRVAPGAVFFALPGARVDGIDYAADAVRAGATAVVCQKEVELPDLPVLVRVPDTRKALSRAAATFFGEPSSRVRVIGVTGTNGKTTVAYLLRAVVAAAGGRCGIVGTIGHAWRGRKIPAANTTPESLDLQKILAEMAAAGVDNAVVEVSSHALDQHRVDDVRFGAAVFTNLSGDHLDYHGSMSAYADAKSRLFSMLAAGTPAVINADDGACGRIMRSCTGRIVCYSMAEDVPGRPAVPFGGRIVSTGLDGIELEVVEAAGTVRITSSLFGTHNAYNLLAAYAAARSLSIDPPAVSRGLASVHCVPGRLERADSGGEFAVVVDYAHTDDALQKVLGSLRPLTRGKLIVVFGCAKRTPGGDYRRNHVGRP